MRLVFASIACVMAAEHATAQCVGFDPRFHVTGTNSYVGAQVVYDDGSGPALFVAGGFTTAGDAAALRIAKWDGAHWSPLGAGVTTGQFGFGSVSSLAAFGGELYAGGDFTVVGGVSAVSLAKWNGTSWSALSSQLNAGARVYDLQVWDDGTGPALYVSGNFVVAGAVTVNNIAKWDGANWSSLAGGTSQVQPSVDSLEVFDDGTGEALYAGGGFAMAGSVPASRIAKWDGANWSALGAGVDGYVFALGQYDDGGGAELYVGGSFVNAGGAPATRIAKWDGSTWSSLGSGLAFNSGINVFTTFDDGNGPVLYAGGDFTSISGVPARYIARWDGANWSALPVDPNSRVDSFLVHDDGSGQGLRLLVGGQWSDLGGTSFKGIAGWDGAQWSNVGPLGLGFVSNSGGAGLFAFDDGSGPAILHAGVQPGAGNDLRKFDGQAWSTWANTGNGLVNAFELHDEGFGGGPQLYVAGTFTTIGGVAANRVARWTGTTWAPLGQGISGGNQQVHDLLSFDDGSGPALYACGHFTVADGVTARRIARWNGASWSEVGGGVGTAASGIGPGSMAVYDDGAGAKLYLAGGFTTSGAIAVGRIARWSGTAWQQVGTGVNGDVHRIAVFDDELYVAGVFTTAGGPPAQYIARWNGTAWSSVGSGLQTSAFGLTISALATFDDGSGSALYVSGYDLIGAGGVTVRGLARWNGASWSDVEGGIVGAVSAMAALPDPLGLGPALFFGGNIAIAGGIPAANFARYGRTWPCAASYCSAGTSANGCAPTLSASGIPSASLATPFVVTASGVEGQKQGLIFYGLSGATSSPWGATSSTLCVKPPQQRTGQSNSGGTSGACDGALVLDWNAYQASHPGALGSPFSVGTTVWVQGWYRDPPSAKTTALTGALEVLLAP